MRRVAVRTPPSRIALRAGFFASIQQRPTGLIAAVRVPQEAIHAHAVGIARAEVTAGVLTHQLFQIQMTAITMAMSHQIAFDLRMMAGLGSPQFVQGRCSTHSVNCVFPS